MSILLHNILRRVPLVKQVLLILAEPLHSSPVLNGVRVTQSLVLYVCFVDCCLSVCSFSFGHFKLSIDFYASLVFSTFDLLIT